MPPNDAALSPARRKRRSSEEILDRIVAAATGEFQENGYSGATTAAIARRAEVTEAQIFRFFPSKAELFREAIFRPLNRHFAAFHADSARAPSETQPARELARQYIDELQEFMTQHSRMLMSLIVADAYSPGAAGRIGQIEGLNAYFDQGRVLMTSRTGKDVAVPPELMVRVSFAAVLACVMFKDWLFPPGIATDAQIRDAIAEFTIDGIRANWTQGF